MEGLVEALRAAAQVALDSTPPDGAPFYTAKDFNAASPPAALALEPGKAYDGKPISVEWPIASAAAGLDEKVAAPEMARFSAMRFHFARILMRAKGGASQRAAVSGQQLGVVLRDQGAPIVRAYVALDSGVHVSYPGVATLPAGFDPRKTSWYKRAITAPGLQWGPPKIDGQGMGVLLTCSTAIIDAKGQVRGAVGIDLALHQLATLYLRTEGVAVESAHLVDRDGRKLLSNTFDAAEGKSEGGKVDTEKPLQTIEFGAAAELARRRLTNYVVSDGKLIVCCPLESLGGTSFLVVADPSGEGK